MLETVLLGVIFSNRVLNFNLHVSPEPRARSNHPRSTTANSSHRRRMTARTVGPHPIDSLKKPPRRPIKRETTITTSSQPNPTSHLSCSVVPFGSFPHPLTCICFHRKSSPSLHPPPNLTGFSFCPFSTRILCLPPPKTCYLGSLPSVPGISVCSFLLFSTARSTTNNIITSCEFSGT